MKNLKLAAFLFAPLLLAGRSYGVVTNGNMPKSASVVATSAKVIPTSFATYLPGFASTLASAGSSTQSLVMTGAAGYGYSHLMVLNNTGSSVAVSLSPYSSPRITPEDSGSSVLYILPNTNAAFDDISIFDNVYIRSNKGATITSGNIDIMVW